MEHFKSLSNFSQQKGASHHMNSDTLWTNTFVLLYKSFSFPFLSFNLLYHVHVYNILLFYIKKMLNLLTHAPLCQHSVSLRIVGLKLGLVDSCLVALLDFKGSSPAKVINLGLSLDLKGAHCY